MEDKSKYEGQFKNGKFDGQGTLYSAGGAIIKKGFWKQGEIHIDVSRLVEEAEKK